MNTYQMEVNNIANYMNENAGKTELDAFICSSVLAVAHGKLKEDVIQDIINAGIELRS
jgi:hypothetical protein